MLIICPRCRYARVPEDDAPHWQCPSCRVAYAKSEADLPRADELRAARRHRPTARRHGNALVWLMLGLFMTASLAAGGWWTWQQRNGAFYIEPSAGPTSSRISDAELRELAATIKPGEIVLYSTADCLGCKDARSWLQQHGFAFTDCNRSLSKRCETEFRRHGGNGTPPLVVRHGSRLHYLGDGFDGERFAALLSS